MGVTATGFCARRPCDFFFDVGWVTVTVGVMYVGATGAGDTAGFVGPTGELVFDDADGVPDTSFVVVLSLLAMSSVVPLSDVNDAFIAATGATGTAMNGTAVIAAMEIATVTCTMRRIRRNNASER